MAMDKEKPPKARPNARRSVRILNAECGRRAGCLTRLYRSLEPLDLGAQNADALR